MSDSSIFIKRSVMRKVVLAICAGLLLAALSSCDVEEPVVPDEPDCVDLGLSVKWARTNLGAESEENLGDYFAWGETAPKEYYNVYQYKWAEIKNMMGTEYIYYTKYSANPEFGGGKYYDGLVTLEKKDDAASKILGEGWRIPSTIEIQELIDKCDWTFTQKNGEYGYLITSKVPGYTDKSIFLPVTGCMVGNQRLQYPEKSYYWSNEVVVLVPPVARALTFTSSPSSIACKDATRITGAQIRAVYTE